VEFVLGDVFERLEPIDAGVVHQHVEPAEGLLGLVEQMPDVGGFRHVAFDGNRLAALGLDVGDDALGALAARRIIHRHRSAGRAQAPGYAGADAFRRAGHDGHLALEIAHDFLLFRWPSHRPDSSISVEVWWARRTARGVRSYFREAVDKGG